MRVMPLRPVALLLYALTATAGDAAAVIPPALQSVDAQMRNFPGAIGPGLALRGRTPLNDEQWTAVAGMPVVSFTCTGPLIDDAGLAHLATLHVESLVLEGCHADDAMPLARMTSLRRLATSHCHLGDNVVAALTGHPSLEEISSDHRVLGEGIGAIATSPKLRRIRLGHAAASDRSAKGLEGNRTLEEVDFWATGAPVLTEAGVLSLTTLIGVRKLSIANTVVTYAGSMERLKNLPQLAALKLDDVDISADDLAKLKADLPKVTLTVVLMTPEERVKWDGGLAYRLKQEASAEKKRVANAAAEKAAAEHAPTPIPAVNPR